MSDSTDVSSDGTTDTSSFGAFGAWVQARAGNALDRYVDNTLAAPVNLTPDGYYRGTDGQIYKAPGFTPAPTAATKSNMLLYVGLAAAAAVVLILIARK